MKKNIDKIIFLLLLALLMVTSFACTEKNVGTFNITKKLTENNKREADNDYANEKKKIVREFSKPYVEKDSKMPSGLKTTWQCVYFGSFPQIEILKAGDILPIDEYALNDDVIYDDELYEMLKKTFYSLYKEHEENIEIDNTKNTNLTIEDKDYYSPYVEIDGEKYIIEDYDYKKDQDNNENYNYKYFTEDKNDDIEIPQYYKKHSNGSIFRYSPIKWRVVDVEGDIITLISDRLLTSMKPSVGPYKWSTSDVRCYLNSIKNSNITQYDKSGFYSTAFNDEERAAIVKTKIKNLPNDYYETSSGEDTEDYVYIPSNAEVFSTELAKEYGFYYGSGVDDAAKRFRSTIYAKYKGAWWSPVDEYKGNSFWYTRTNGYSDMSVSYICDFGYIYSRGMNRNTKGAGVLPMIRVDVSKIDLYDAGFVSSDEINKDTYKFKNIDEKNENTQNDDNKSSEEIKKETSNVEKNYEIIEIGNYPQREVVTTEMIKDKMFYLKEGEYILDDELYKKLDQLVDISQGYIELDDEKYLAARNWKGHLSNMGSDYLYNKDRKNNKGEDYHYFKVEPIKWRVLESANGEKTLISDKVIDRAKFYLSSGECTWLESDILDWLNLDDEYHTSFYSIAFNKDEQSRIITKTFTKENMKNNFYFGTSCMPSENSKKASKNVDVKVYILSEEDLFYGDKARIYRFDKSDGVEDMNRRFKTTAYARFQDVWFSKKDDENYGNAFYMTRTNGYDRQNIVYVGETGSIYNRGIDISTDDIGFLPVIDIR